MTLVRLQKFLAEAGVASRRASEQIILAGRVTVNGETVRLLGTKVHPTSDRVLVDGQKVRGRKKIYIALNKPEGYHCTRKDPSGRRIVNELLPAEWASLHTVGRLDCESEGLIFLSNDGEFTQRISHPRYEARKVYLVEVEGRVLPAMIAQLQRGIVDAGERLKAERGTLISANNTRSVLELVLAEGKNREIRRMFGSFNLHVSRLQRIQIGPIKLGQLTKGKWRTLTESEINSLLAKI